MKAKARIALTSILLALSFFIVSSAAVRGPQRPAAPPPAEAQAAGVDALTALRDTGARFRPWQPRAGSARANLGCAVNDGVVLLRGPTGARYSKAPLVSAAFAVKLARFEQIANEEALRVFGKPLARIEHFGTYVCRPVAGTTDVASQHAFGNAIDVSAFQLRGGRRVSVQRDFTRVGAAPSRPASVFLAAVVTRARDERLFGTVLTPDFDARHHDHLHLDGREWRRFWPRWLSWPRTS